MKYKFYTLLFATISTLAFSCKTANKLYEKGHYDEAVELAAKKLQKDPSDPKLLDILKNSYRFAVEDHERQISSYASSSNELKWEWTYQEYLSLQRLYESIRRSPDVFNRVNPTDYSSHLVTYREKRGKPGTKGECPSWTTRIRIAIARHTVNSRRRWVSYPVTGASRKSWNWHTKMR